ncbi:MAG: hypothetical protein AB2693_32200 [Candidatus Thiodiazotropha sp.]
MGRKFEKKAEKTEQSKCVASGELENVEKVTKKNKQRKRKKSKGSPNGPTIQPAEKRPATMSSEQSSPVQSQSILQGTLQSGLGLVQPILYSNTSPIISQTPTQGSAQQLSMSQSTQLNMMQQPAALQGTLINNQALLERLESIDSKLKSLDNIERKLSNMCSQISNLDSRLSVNESSVKTLNSRVQDIEESRSFDSEYLEKIKETERRFQREITLNKQMRTDLDKAAEEREKIKKDIIDLNAKATEEREQMRNELTDLKGRSMRNNLLFYNFPEQNVDQKNEKCEEKIYEFCELELEMPNVRSDVKIERAHRIGAFKRGKTRPIVAMFNNYKDKEEIKKIGFSKLTNSRFSVGDQFPKLVQDRRRKLMPVKKAAMREGKRAVFSYDKLYIDGELYEFPANDSGNRADIRNRRQTVENGDQYVYNTATSSGTSRGGSPRNGVTMRQNDKTYSNAASSGTSRRASGGTSPSASGGRQTESMDGASNY